MDQTGSTIDANGDDEYTTQGTFETISWPHQKQTSTTVTSVKEDEFKEESSQRLIDCLVEWHTLTTGDCDQGRVNRTLSDLASMMSPIQTDVEEPVNHGRGFQDIVADHDAADARLTEIQKQMNAASKSERKAAVSKMSQAIGLDQPTVATSAQLFEIIHIYRKLLEPVRQTLGTDLVAKVCVKVLHDRNMEFRHVHLAWDTDYHRFNELLEELTYSHQDPGDLCISRTSFGPWLAGPVLAGSKAVVQSKTLVKDKATFAALIRLLKSCSAERPGEDVTVVIMHENLRTITLQQLERKKNVNDKFPRDFERIRLGSRGSERLVPTTDDYLDKLADDMESGTAPAEVVKAWLGDLME